MTTSEHAARIYAAPNWVKPQSKATPKTRRPGRSSDVSRVGRQLVEILAVVLPLLGMTASLIGLTLLARSIFDGLLRYDGFQLVRIIAGF